jgi:hypothetical protein
MSDALFDDVDDHTPDEPFTARRRQPAPSPRTEAKQAQADRHRSLTAEGHIVVVGKTGATIQKNRK